MSKYRPCATFLQKPHIQRKPRLSIPTAKRLTTSSHPPGQFYELPEGTNVGDVDWKCSGLGTQEIQDLPKEIKEFFSTSQSGSNELYTATYSGNTGVWYAVLFAIDPNFITRTMGNQQKCVQDVKKQMCIELDDYYQKYKYRQYGYSKSDMDKLLTCRDEYHPTLGHFLTDYLEVNVLVLLESKRFHWLGRFDESRVTIVLYHKGAEWLPVAHSDQSSHLFDVATIKALTERLMHASNMDASQKHENLVIDSGVLSKLKREIKNMKIKDLQDRAVQLEMHIHDENGKKKLKKVLQEEIYEQLTGTSL